MYDKSDTDVLIIYREFTVSKPLLSLYSLTTSPWWFSTGMLLLPPSHPSRCFNSLPRKTPPSPSILVEHVAPDEDRYTRPAPPYCPHLVKTLCYSSACLLVR